MNRIHRLIPRSLGHVFSFSLLLAVFLTGSILPAAEPTPAGQCTEMLDNHAATKLLTRVVRPVYPPVAKLNYIQGTVKVGVKVNAKGKVVEAHVLEGEPLLAAAALKAVRKWRFRPYISSDGPSSFDSIFGIKFQLRPHQFGAQLPEHANAFLEKQIRPPKVASRPEADPPSGTKVKFRVLVNSEGKVMDAVPIGAKKSEAMLAKRILRRWKFLPAHWGAIAVPWYLIVKVPLVHALVDQAANSTGR